MTLWMSVMLAACSKGSQAPSTDDEGGWYATDLHVHSALGSNDAGSDSTISAIGDMAVERGISLVVITDHSNSAGSMACPTGDVEDCPNQGPEFPALSADGVGPESLIQVGVEASPVVALSGGLASRGHIGCLPRRSDAFVGVEDAIVDRPLGEVSGGAAVSWCKTRGGLAVVNHPFSPARWLAYDWTSMAYDALEVFNGGGRFDQWDWSAVMAWACDVSEGRPVTPVGGSDTHRIDSPTPPEGPLDQALGFPTTWVWSESSSPDDLLAALAAGHTLVADPETSLAVKAWSGRAVARPGETLRVGGGDLSLEVGVLVASEGLVLEVVDLFSGACVEDTRTPDQVDVRVEPETLLSVSLTPAELHQERLTIDSGSVERLVVWVRPEATEGLGHLGVALSAPITVVVD